MGKNDLCVMCDVGCNMSALIHVTAPRALTPRDNEATGTTTYPRMELVNVSSNSNDTKTQTAP